LYVPLVRRAYELWSAAAEEAGETLMMQTGGIMVGPETGPLVQGALDSVRTHHIVHEMLDAGELAGRFPAYRARNEWVAVFEHRAGMLFPERCVRAFLSLAEKCGATLRLNEKVTRWSQNEDGVVVRSADGAA